MTIAIVSSIAALAGVWLGKVLDRSAEAARSEREHDVWLRDQKLAAFSGALTAFVRFERVERSLPMPDELEDGQREALTKVFDDVVSSTSTLSILIGLNGSPMMKRCYACAVRLHMRALGLSEDTFDEDFETELAITAPFAPDDGTIDWAFQELDQTLMAFRKQIRKELGVA